MDTVVVFTRKNLENMFEQGGCGDWVASEERLGRCTYLVATANAKARRSRHAAQGHGHAFLLGRICGSKEAPENPGRRIIQISEYAEIDVPNGWAGQRNPVRYTALAEFGINPETLQWTPFPTDREKAQTTPPLTIDQAKQGLAQRLGIAPECIEIQIRA